MDKDEDISKLIPPGSFIWDKGFSDLDLAELQFVLANQLKIEDDLQEINEHVKTCEACHQRLDGHSDAVPAMRDYYGARMSLFAEATVETLHKTADKVAVHMNRPGPTWPKNQTS